MLINLFMKKFYVVVAGVLFSLQRTGHLQLLPGQLEVYIPKIDEVGGLQSSLQTTKNKCSYGNSQSQKVILADFLAM